MTILLLEGWHFVQASEKRHYFKEGHSLCGRFQAVSPPVSNELLRHRAFLLLRAVRTEATDGNEPAAENGKTLDIYEWYV